MRGEGKGNPRKYMCGIAGLINIKGDIKSCEKILQTTLERINHRGPDYRGMYSDTINSWNICLGVNRLAIIDVGPSGNQPMYLDNLVIAYNGEIYNYIELKEELTKSGHKFKGGSDTEVVLHAFKEWGLSAISKFIGMFSIAIFDKAERKLYLIRDRVGEKPLYYYHNKGMFIFSSELKGILTHDFLKREFDRTNVFNYLIFNTVPTPNTLLKGIKQISAGEVLILSFGSDSLEIKNLRYWNLPELIPDYALTEKRVLSDLTNLIYNAVKIRLRSDVPIGIFLSGGIDSSLVAAIASEISPYIKTFTISYKDQKYNEGGYAEFVSKYLKVDHTSILLDENTANLNFKELSYISDDCTGNLTFIPYVSLAQKAREHVKVALSGDGGDEFFCGYTDYNIIIKLFKYKNLKFLLYLIRFYKKAKILLEILSKVDNLLTLTAQFRIRDKLIDIKSLFTGDYADLRIFERMPLGGKLLPKNIKQLFWFLNYYDGANNYLPDTVLKTTDRASMYYGLETRPIFTDYRIIEYMSKVPENLILKGGINKFLLRNILSKYLPKRFVFKRPKRGFSVPLTSDYKDTWNKTIIEAKDIFLNIGPALFNLKQLEIFLNKNRNSYNLEIQSRLVFLANFMGIWRIAG